MAREIILSVFAYELPFVVVSDQWGLGIEAWIVGCLWVLAWLLIGRKHFKLHAADASTSVFKPKGFVRLVDIQIVLVLVVFKELSLSDYLVDFLHFIFLIFKAIIRMLSEFLGWGYELHVTLWPFLLYQVLLHSTEWGMLS